jgi:hypothetical protein
VDIAKPYLFTVTLFILLFIHYPCPPFVVHPRYHKYQLLGF